MATRKSKACKACGKEFLPRKSQQRCDDCLLPKCEHCGKRFHAVSKTRRFCSLECSYAAQGSRTNQERQCRQCGKVFMPKAVDRTEFCGRDCSFAWKAENKTPELSKVYYWSCRRCGQPQGYRRRKPPHRCEACESAYRSERARALHEQKRGDDARVCSVCGVSYQKPYGSAYRAFCSDECTDAAKKTTKHIERAKRWGVDYEPISKAKVFERDNWTCKLCGRKTRRHYINPWNARNPELDHIVPVSLGGSHTYDNVQCACSQCNARKGNRKAIGQLHLFPREQKGYALK